VSLVAFSVATDGTMCPVVDSASKNEYEDTPGCKDGRCVTTFIVPKVKKIRSLDLPYPLGRDATTLRGITEWFRVAMF
jgi:hypothetical protein